MVGMESGENILILDLGVCEFCGATYEHTAPNGRAWGRKAPDACCAHATARTIRMLAGYISAMENIRIRSGRTLSEAAMAEVEELRAEVARLQKVLEEQRRRP